MQLIVDSVRSSTPASEFFVRRTPLPTASTFPEMRVKSVKILSASPRLRARRTIASVVYVRSIRRFPRRFERVRVERRGQQFAERRIGPAAVGARVAQRHIGAPNSPALAGTRRTAASLRRRSRYRDGRDAFGPGEHRREHRRALGAIAKPYDAFSMFAPVNRGPSVVSTAAPTVKFEYRAYACSRASRARHAVGSSRAVRSRSLAARGIVGFAVGDTRTARMRRRACDRRAAARPRPPDLSPSWADGEKAHV